MQPHRRHESASIILLSILCMLFFFAASAPADTQVSGTISTDTTWTLAGSPYVVTGTIYVQGTDGADSVTTLTIEPGAQVRFNRNQILYIGNGGSIPGALNAQGTEDAPIVFTSNQTAPAPGDWYGINFQSTAAGAASILSHCTIQYAGYGNNGAVTVNGAAPTLSACRFENNAAYDLYYSGTVGGAVSGCQFTHGLNMAGSGRIAFSGNSFNWDDAHPVRLPANNAADLVADSTFSGLGAASALQVTTGTLSLDSTWKASIPYAMTTYLTVQGTDGADGVTTLTIEPGAQVRFNPHSYLYIGNGGSTPGALNAQGTEAAPIVFTSNQTAPAPGDWYGIYFQATAVDTACVLAHCTVQYAGYNNTAAVTVNSAAPMLSACRFENNATYDLYYGGTVGGTVSGCEFNHGLNMAGSGRIAFSGNSFNWDDAHPVRLPANNVADLVADSTFSGLDVASALKVTTGTLSLDSTWRASIPYAITTYLTVQGTDGADGVTTLTIEPGAQVRFNPHLYFYIGNGSAPGALNAQGTAAAPIVFTSNAAVPAAGDWYGIQFNDSAADALSKLDYCTVEYGGYSSADIYLYHAAPTIQHSLIRNSSTSGIYIYGSGSNGALIACNNIKDNVRGITLAGSAQPQIGDNNFINNQDYGIYNGSSLQVTTINNWWGSAGGPGTGGDAVYGNVIYDPWRSAPSECVGGVESNDPPLAAKTPQPADGATGVAFADTAVVLSWVGGDPNPADTVVYDLWWGTDSAALSSLAQNLTTSSYTATGIQPNTTYYWRIVTRDNHGAATSGPTWHFTTAPPQPDLVVSNLSWTPDTGIVAGQTVTFTATVTNSGPGATSQNFGVAFQVNASRSTQWVYQSVPAGQSVQVSYQWTAQVGAATVTVESDSTHALAENDETNNDRTADLGTIPDTTPPEMTSTSPADGAFLQQVSRIDVYLTDRFGGSIDTAATLATFTVLHDGQAVTGTTSVSGNRFSFVPAQALAEGGYQVSLTVYDTAGNHAAYSFGFTIDMQKPAPPVVTGGSVTSGTIQPRPAQNRSNKSTVTLTGTREDNSAITINGSVPVALGSGPWSCNIGLSQGDNALEIRSRDAAGNVSDPVYVDMYVDSVAPAITAMSPAANSFVNSPPAAVVLDYTEATSGIDASAVTHTVSDGNMAPVNGTWTDSAGKLQFVPAVSFSDGVYTVQARLVDNLGNASAPMQSVFTVDTSAPPAPVIEPVTSPTHAATQAIQGQKEAFAAILMDGQQIVDHTAGTTWQYTATLASGNNTFSFTARDRAGNQSPPAQAVIVFDDIAPPPVTNLTADGNGVGTSVLLNWIGYDEASQGDIQEYRVYCEAAPFSSITGLTVKGVVAAGSYTHVVQNLTTGTPYWFAVVAVDRMGNLNPAVTPVTATPTDTLPPGNVNHLSVQSFADRLIFTWQPPTSNQSDLAGYKVYFNGAEAETLPPDVTTSERTGLAPAGAYAFKITSYDQQNNESCGAALTGYTWLDNPAGLSAEPFDGYVQLTWNPVTPAANLGHYAVYVSANGAFTSVQGLTPAITTTGTQAKVAGLVNNQTYYFAVTSVNRSNGEQPQVTTVSAEPTPDQSGPQMSDVRIDAQPLANGTSISKAAAVTLNASDPSGVSRIEFLLDGGPFSIDYSAPYRCDLDITQIPDGAHTLAITAYDTLNNSTTLSYTLDVGMALPAAPAITQPKDGDLTNQTAVTVQGQAEKQCSVILYLAGQAVGAPLSVDDQGRFTGTMTLSEGANQIQAAARNRAGTGPLSQAVSVTVDTSRPSAPGNVTAQAIEGGVVRLTWSPPTGKLVSSYNIYRSDAPFSQTTAATKVNADPVSAAGYRDLPPADGTWYYRLTSVDQAHNESDPSLQVSAVADSVPPRVSALVYAPKGQVDPVSGAVAPGLVDVTMTVSEPLMAKPFLSITPQAGMPITIVLTQTGDTQYTGQFTILDSTPGGTAYAVFSGRDQAGNRGTDIDSGASLLLDTQGPAVRRIVLNPAAPIKNDAQNPVALTVTIGLNEAVADGTSPALQYLLSGPGRSLMPIAGLAQIPAAEGDAQTWQAVFSLPSDAGQDQVETLQFQQNSQDKLGNSSDRILAPNQFQVYQGDLPPLDAPEGLTAKALSGGRIDLSWNSVAQAVGYQLYRQGPNESELTMLARLEGQTLVYQDATQMDGTYQYAVTSLRSENGQEAESGRSNIVSVDADAQAPPAPQGFTLQLIPLGIQADWQAVNEAGISYRLYRSDAMQITSIDGLTPVDALFDKNKALDRHPSPTDHTYVVTAVDPAGNESAPSQSVYLNFDLLPAASIDVVQTDNEKPVLSWTHPGGSLAGFNVYMGPVGQTVKVNSDPVSELSMTDEGFAGDAREYAVIAVDANQAESPARTIMLPQVSAERADSEPLRRGIMNQLEYNVTNASAQAVNNLQLIVHLHGKDHPSAMFSLSGHQTRAVQVVVAGYDDLQDVEPLTLTIQMTPNEGETARIVRSGQIQVGEGMLALQLYNDAMIRGGTGKVWFTLENTGQADIEIVTAKAGGHSPSDEAAFQLLDADGNVLSTLALQQALGDQVVNLSNGTTVARIPAGAVFESAPMQIPVPVGTPDDPTLRMSIGHIYYHYGQPDQLSMRGLSSTHPVSIIETDYTGTITQVDPAVTTGLQDVKISGRAVQRDTGQPVPNAALNLILTLNGFERKIPVQTDGNGDFVYTFTPLQGENGTYKVAALHPDLLDRPVQATFTVTRVDIKPANIRLNMPKNYQQTIPIEVDAGPDTQVHNLHLVFDDWDQPANAFAQGVTYDLGQTIAELDPQQKATINVTISSDNTAADSGSLVFRLVSDETGVQPWGFVRIDAQLTEAKPQLTYTPNFVETGVLLGGMDTETVTLENKGLADLEGVTLSLIGDNQGPAPDWVVLNAPTQAGTLAVGQKLQVPIAFAPGASVPEGLYTFYLHVEAADYPATDIGLYVSATPSGIGSALFKVKDIYTGTLNERNEVIQGLAGARITLQNEKNLTIVYDQTCDEYGEALFNNLSAGLYKYRVRAANHQEKTGQLWIKPGLTTSEEMFLEYNFVTVEWEVVETTVQDKYNIVLNITYETDVPAPVVVCDPPSVSLPDMKAGDVLDGEFTLTNYGLIRADNLKITLPADDQYIHYELLAPVPASLGAKERVTIPYRLTCIQSLSNDEVQTGGSGGCYGACITTTYSGTSPNGCPYSGSAQSCFSRPCGSPGGSSGVGSGWWYGVYGGGGTGVGGGSGSSTGTPIDGGSSSPCTPPPKFDPTQCAASGAGSGSKCGDKDSKKDACQPTGSSVNLLIRGYNNVMTDLTVKVPGGSIDITRSFYNDGDPYYQDEWHWQHNRSLVFDTSQSTTTTSMITPDGATIRLKPIKRDGITYRPDPNKSVIDMSSGEQVILRPEIGTDRIIYEGADTWRWEDHDGNWERYDFDKSKYDIRATVLHAGAGELRSYGNRQGTIANLIYDDNDILTGIADRNGRQVIWFDYTMADNGHHIIGIHDLANRRIEYEVSYFSGGPHDCYIVPQLLIYRFTDAAGNTTGYDYGPINAYKWSQATWGDFTPHVVAHSSSSGGGGGSSGGEACIPPPRIGLRSVTDPDGRTKTITYGSEGAVASVLDADGNGYKFQFSYDAKTREYYAQAADTNGKVKEVWIDSQGEAKRVDVNGRTVKTYAKDGNTYTITDENGNQTIKEYDQWDNLVHVVYPDGAEVRYEYDPDLQKVIKKIDENQVVTRYTYDDAGRLNRRVEAYSTDLQRTTEFEYDSEGNLITIRRPGDADTADAITTMTYDGDGNMLSLTDPEGNLTTFTYDVAGNVLTKTDPRGKTWTYTYDLESRLTGVTDPLGNQTRYFYDPAGNKIRAIDPEGKETQYEYDARDNLKKSINPAMEAAQIDSTFDGRVLGRTDAEGHKTRYQYDADGRLSKSIDGNGNAIDLTYSGDTGSGCSTCGGGGSSDQPSVIQFPTFKREIKYDGRGRKYAQRDVLDNDTAYLTRFTYDGVGNLTSKTDAEGRVTTYEYDLLNRLTRVIDAAGGWTSYAYDKRDNLIALTDAENHITRFAYDRDNRLVKEIRPMGQETNYAYDPAGNLIEKIDAKNQRIAYTYDDAGRLTGIRYFAAAADSTAAKTVIFSYDAAGHLTGYDDGTTSASYSYDDADRKVSEIVNYPGFSKTMGYTYYKNGLKKTFTGPNNIAYGYLYDSNNQLTGVQIPDVGMFTVNSYDWNRPAQETLPGGGKQSYGYDPLMRVTDIASQDPGGNQQLNYGYTYDKVDNITAKQTEHGDYSYQYDSLDRLTDAGNPDQADESFDYDGVGNRTGSAATTGAWTYNANNELEGYDDVAFKYDANGNMIEKNAGGVVTKFFYNLEDRLERVEDGTGNVIATYYYDPFGRRLWKDVSGTRTYFGYSDEGLIGEYDAAGAEIKTYGWKPGSAWSTDPLFMKIGSEYYWYHNDHLGTPQMMTTSSGAVVWKARCSSFGNATVDGSSTVVNPLRFPGQYGDMETGLHYNLFRYYMPQIARYLNNDPIGYLGGLNQYLYARNNSNVFNDAFGLKSKTYVTFSMAGGFGIPLGDILVGLAIEGGVVFAIDPCDPSKINMFRYLGAGPGFGRGAATTIEVGLLNGTDDSPNSADPLGITGFGWVISWFKANGIGASGQIYGDGDTFGFNPIGIAIGEGQGISGLITRTWYAKTISSNSLPKSIKDLYKKTMPIMKNICDSQKKKIPGRKNENRCE